MYREQVYRTALYFHGVMRRLHVCGLVTAHCLDYLSSMLTLLVICYGQRPQI